MENKQTDRRLYLAYGSNLSRGDMAHRCPDAKVVGPVMLEGYELQFRGQPGSSYATIEPKEGGVVPALVWEITPRCEESLDYYEGYPRLYRKATLTVELEGGGAEVMVYLMNGHAPAEPSSAYLQTMLNGYDKAGFDRSVMDTALEETRRIYTLLTTIRENQEQKVYMPCPRCGRWWMDEESPFKNARSRVTDIQVCDRCGNVEALEHLENRLRPVPAWYAVEQPDRFRRGEGIQ